MFVGVQSLESWDEFEEIAVEAVKGAIDTSHFDRDRIVVNPAESDQVEQHRPVRKSRGSRQQENAGANPSRVTHADRGVMGKLAGKT